MENIIRNFQNGIGTEQRICYNRSTTYTIVIKEAEIMLKKFFIAIMCIAVLLSIVACSKDNTQQNDNSTNQSAPSSISDISKEENDTNEITSTTFSNDSMSDTTEVSTESKVVFRTENVIRITFYAYYGAGKGSDVPAEYLNEIISWLDSFEVDTDKEFPELVPPGTNTVHVEIEYSDGSIIKQGIDTTVVDGVTYYIKGTTPPEFYDEIISKTSLT